MSSRLRRGQVLVGDSIQPSTLKTRSGFISTSKQGQFYKPLESHFHRGQFNFKQIAREGDLTIYQQTWRRCSEPSICYELIRIRRHNGKTIKGHWVAPSEFYPSSTEWGKYGRTFTDQEAAFAKLREIINFKKKESANPIKKSPIQNTKRCSETKRLRGDVKNRRDG